MAEQNKRYVMVIDLKKCLGCKTCTISCNKENSILTTKTWNVVLDTIEGDFPSYKRKFLPRPCMHCEKPPCVNICPTGASFRRDDVGVVLVNHNACSGCRACITACPYDARVFNWEEPEEVLTENPVMPKRQKGIVEKCTFCIHRIDEAHAEGKQVGTTIHERDNKKVVVPACVEECIGVARYFGDLNDPESEVSEILRKNKHFTLAPEAGTQPNVFYLDMER